MQLIKKIETGELAGATPTKADPGILIAGDPTFRAWVQDEARDGTILSGSWEATPGHTISRKGERYEFCLLLEGEIEITEQDGGSATFRAGDAFVMKPGFVGTWRTIAKVRKLFVVIDPPPA